MTKQTTTKFYGKLTLLEIGQFKPITLVPLDDTATFAITVPVTAEYVDNAVAMLTGPINAEQPNPVWTDKGVEFIYSKLNEMVNPTVKPEDFKPEDKPVEVEGWDD